MTPAPDPPPERMSAPEYAAHRRGLLAMFMVRVACAGAVVYLWDELPLIGKVVGFAIAAVVVPNVGSIKRVFLPYERYLQEERHVQE